MKSILMSIRPQWVVKILNKEKTIEIRKKFPKDYLGWVYIYCTKDKKYANLINRGGFLTGMVVARFWCDKVEKTKPYMDKEQQKLSCLSAFELMEYLQGKTSCAIHITKLEIFGKPKEISEFYKKHYPQFAGLVENTIHYELLPLTRAPQSWCYIYE